MLECAIRDVRNFVSAVEERPVDATKLYAGEGLAWRFLIPDGKNEHENLTFVEVIICPVYG